MSNRMRALTHLRSNAVGYVALFVALGSGSAMAANTVFSTDIVNGEVKTADIGGGEVGTSDIANDAVSGAKVLDDTLGNVDLKSGSVRATEVANGTLTGDDIQNGSISPDDTDGLALSAGIPWAVVDADGTVSRSSEPVSVVAEGDGDYEVRFVLSVDGCASVAQISKSSFGDGDPGPGEVATNQGEENPRDVDVRTYDSAGVPADSSFTVHVLCGPSTTTPPIAAARSRR